MVQVELRLKGALLLSDKGMCSLKPLETTPVVIAMSVSEKINRYASLLLD